MFICHLKTLKSMEKMIQNGLISVKINTLGFCNCSQNGIFFKENKVISNSSATDVYQSGNKNSYVVNLISSFIWQKNEGERSPSKLRFYLCGTKHQTVCSYRVKYKFLE